MENFRNFRCKIRPEDGFSCENDIILVYFTHLLTEFHTWETESNQPITGYIVPMKLLGHMSVSMSA